MRDLTGGIPRTAVLLFELFAAGFSEDTFDDLVSLLDSVTPLYQSRLDQLSDQGKTIVGVLARHWAPITKRDIGEISRIPDGSVSPQLGRLRDIGFVEEVPVHGTSRTGYQIAERFFNIWYLMRFATRRQRAHLSQFANFLTGFYTPGERVQCAERLLMQDDWNSTTIQYAMALAESLLENHAIACKLDRKAQLQLVEHMGGIRERIAEILDPSEIDERIFKFAELKRRLAEKVPSDADMDPREFAALVVGSPSLIPCATKTFDRRGIATSEVSPEQFGQMLEILWNERKEYAALCSQEAVEWLCTELGGGAITSWDNIDQVNALTCEACSRDQARLLSGVMPPTAKHKLSDNAFQSLSRLCMPAEDASSEDWTLWGSDLHLGFNRAAEAEVAYRKAIELDPAFAYSWNGLGNLLTTHLARYEEAETAYRKAIELDPAGAYPWNGLGNLLQDHLTRYEEAETAYRKAIELDPASAVPWNGLGNLLQYHLARYEEAETAYRKAIELDPAGAYPWYGLGNLLKTHLGRYEEAEVAYRKAIELDPADASPWFGLGNLLRDHLRRYDEAEAAYRKAIEIDATDGRPWNNLGNLLQYHLERYEGAEEAYRKAIELDPALTYAWNGLGNILKNHLGRYEEAETAYRKAIELDPADAYPWNGLGNLLQDHLARFEEAETAYRKAIELDPAYAAPWNGLGNLLQDHLGRYEEAEAAYRKAIDEDPANDMARHNLAFLLRDHAGDADAASRLLNTLNDENAWLDTQHLHRALFAAYNDNWRIVTQELSSALREAGSELPTSTRDDWYRASAVLLHLGFGPKLVEFLEEEGADIEMMPWFEAVRAHVEGDRRYLQNIAAEARPVAEKIFDEIAIRRKHLPEKTRRDDA